MSRTPLFARVFGGRPRLLGFALGAAIAVVAAILCLLARWLCAACMD